MKLFRPPWVCLLLALLGLGLSLAPVPAPAAEPYAIPRCELQPLAHQEVSFQIAGEERFRWHAAPDSPRPFFFPLAGPAGGCLTRIGHPGAPDHDHHRSVWFAHHDVAGADFWSEHGATRIRQKEWLCYRDGDDEAVMACTLGWFGPEDRLLLEQELVAALIPLVEGEYALELQATFTPPPGQDSVALGKTNFGLLAVRLAKSISEYFGGGLLTNSEGAQHEPAIFGKKARWMDYSGPVATGTGGSRQTVWQGITFHDHPANPRYPSAWHVRQDGWMGASFCLEEPFTITRETPLRLRYLLHAHRGGYQPEAAQATHHRFALRPGFEVVKGQQIHGRLEVRRLPASPAPSAAP